MEIDAIHTAIGRAINNALPIITDEIKEKKYSYFTEEGKAGWMPLKDSTIQRKAKRAALIGNANRFNYEYGFLRNNIVVDAVYDDNVISIRVTATHRDGDIALSTLIDKYGRDFLRFDQEETSWIIKRLKELIIGYLRGELR